MPPKYSLAERTEILNAQAAEVGMDDAYGAAQRFMMKKHSQKVWRASNMDHVERELDHLLWSDLLDIAEKQIRNQLRGYNTNRDF